jgi:dipeptidyl aminopeptidase/acylaminoacyl peptidase
MRKLLAALLLSTLIATPAVAATPNPLSMQSFWQQEFVGKDLKLGKILARTGAYTKYAVTYRSNGLRISGIMNVPKGNGPFPLVVLAHGYIDPDIYRTGQGLAREQDYLARKGFIAFHTDYRNHASSDDDPNLMRGLRLGYTMDVINAANAARNASLTFIDKERISLLGRSMGGGIGFNTLVSAPGVFDSAVLFATVSSKAAENTNKWLRNDPVIRKEIFAKYGSPESNPAFWDSVSAYTHFDRVSDPVLVLHGTADETCPIRWANEAVAKLKSLNKDVTYVTYKGAGHTFFGNTWTKSMQESVKFLKRTMA